MSDAERVRRRATFDDVAELYDRVRPGYPAECLTELAALADLGPGSRVLEIGAGTGKLTVPLAERGYAVLAIELGERMAAVARRNLAQHPHVELVVADFDRWPGARRGPFDLAVVATAFHWLDPNTRLRRIATLLRPGGALGTITTFHIAGGDTSFFRAAQSCYRRWDASTPANVRLPTAAEVPMERDLEHGGWFGPCEFRRYEWIASYATTDYLDLLRTYSTTLALSPHARRGLLSCIGELIDTRYGGRISKRYLTELKVARRSSFKPVNG